MKRLIAPILLACLASSAFALDVVVAGGSAAIGYTGATPGYMPAVGATGATVQLINSPLYSTGATGNVGIGTTNPTKKVHVSSGTLYVDGTSAAIETTGSGYFAKGSATPILLGTDGTISAYGTITASRGASTSQGNAGLKITGSAFGLRDTGTTDGIVVDMYNGAAYQTFMGWRSNAGGNTVLVSSATLMVDGNAATAFKVGTSSLTLTSAGNLSVVGFMAPGSKTQAQIEAIDPGAAGEMYYCSNCAASAVCISTGTAVGDFADIGDRTAQCD